MVLATGTRSSKRDECLFRNQVNIAGTVKVSDRELTGNGTCSVQLNSRMQQGANLCHPSQARCLLGRYIAIWDRVVVDCRSETGVVRLHELRREKRHERKDDGHGNCHGDLSDEFWRLIKQ